MSFLVAVLLSLFLIAGLAIVDAPLKSRLDLHRKQVKQLKGVKEKYRKNFSSARQKLHQEKRKLRRARIDNDSIAVARLDVSTAELAQHLKQLRDSENEEIRQILTPDQNEKFEEALSSRKNILGSSKDVEEY